MKLRIKFSKHGAIRYIGHLDVMRFFQKAIRRAEIDVTYSQGFSPHQIMSFAQPLSVGHESNGEYMDIQVNSMVSCEDIKNRLNEASVEGIQVLSVIELPDNAVNAMASVAAAEYTVTFKEGRAPKLNIYPLIPEFLTREQILYTKESKKGTRQVDLKPGIYRLECDENGQTIRMLLDASSGSNIKPVQVIEALLEAKGEQLQENALMVTRQDTYTNLGTEENPQLVPLDDPSLSKEVNRESSN